MLFFSLRVNEFTSLLVDSSQVMLLISIRSHKNKCHAKNNTCPQTDKKNMSICHHAVGAVMLGKGCRGGMGICLHPIFVM